MEHLTGSTGAKDGPGLDWPGQANRGPTGEGVRRTGKGVVAMLTSPPVWASAYRRWCRAKKNPLVACPETIKRALN
jgi:hypothetical protein